ncbi:signal transduction protein [Nostoc minutum NIES-26]|uniref:Signal transduction protein n=1 Tax=Nostoc minutum NIES-26 TaxID=1844469 RepID=A0A367S039_9NOSO|nr:signal transduction protein [Nostoc minutum NIES-26]
MTSTEGIALQVDDVYVPLGLIERKKPSKPQGDISPEQGSELYKETEITKTFEHDAFLEEVLKQKNTPKSQGKRIAIIGEPGAGKTTLLQQIADWVSREIDQSIVIWVSLADLQGKELKSYLFDSWLTQVAEKTGKAQATEQLKDDFVALFNQNKVWLLLDGLDEMSASSGNPLTEIARQLREARLISQARIVLTCRINLWDGSSNALDDFDTYRTLNFSYPQQVERFIHKWFAAIPKTGNQLCTALKESGKERIQDLVKNPLRLTLLCLNWQSGDGKLPDTQARLYQQFVDDFYQWKKEEFAITSNQRQQLNVKLGELAKEAIDKEATRFRLGEDFVSQFLGNADDENSLLKLSLNRGWLNCIGIDTNRKPVYAFFHASFQEYFAATAIDDWHFFLNHVPKNPSQGTYRIFEPQWKQTILYWLGRPEKNLKQQKQQFIDALVNFKDGCGKWDKKYFPKGFYEYRTYFLAATGIAEFRDYSRADEIVAQIIKWYFTNSFILPTLIKEEAWSALQQTDRPKAIAALVQLLEPKDVPQFLTKAIAALVELRQSTDVPLLKKAIPALIQLLKSQDVDSDTRMLVAESLGKINPGNEKAITTLVQLLQSQDVYKTTRLFAAAKLVQIDPSNENAIVTLVEFAKTGGIPDYHNSEILREMKPNSEKALAALLPLLQSKDVNYRIRLLSAESLDNIDTGNKKAIPFLLQLLQSQVEQDYTYWQAAKNLLRIDPGNKKAITTLFHLLLSDYVHLEAAELLSEIHPDKEYVISALLQFLQSQDEDDYSRTLAAGSLGKIDPGNKIAIATLVQLLNHEENYIHLGAASNLRKIATGNEFAITTLEQVLQSQDLNIWTRWLTARALGQIDLGNENAIATLLQLLKFQEFNDYDRWQVAESLVEIDPGNESAIATLLQLLKSQDESYNISMKAADSLCQFCTSNEFVIAGLVQLLQSLNVYECEYPLWTVIESLGKIDPGNENAIMALLQLLQSKDVYGYVHWVAALELEKIGTGNENAINALLQMLQSTDVIGYTRACVKFTLEKILQDNKHCFAVAKALSNDWRYGKYYSIALKCAQNMPYPDFYQAWHQHNVATRAMQSFAKILFIRII